MNLKAIVATLEEKCPNLFDQVRAGSWLVAARGPAANHSPATIGIGFIPVAGAGVAAGGARRATGRRTAGLDSIRWSGDWRRNVHPRYTTRQPVTQPQWSDLKGKKSLHFVWTQSGGCSCSEERELWGRLWRDPVWLFEVLWDSVSRWSNEIFQILDPTKIVLKYKWLAFFGE